MTEIPIVQTAPWRYGGQYHEGGRATQEDRFGFLAFRTADGMEALLAFVADGIGGRSAGEMASHLAQQVIPEYVRDKAPAASEISQTLVAAFHEANDRIYTQGADDPSRGGMGTTCTAVVIVGHRMYLAHVGDSRAYLVRGNRIQQLSFDHTAAQEAVRTGARPEDVLNHPNRNVIKRYLGITPDINVDTSYLPLGETDFSTALDSASKPVALERGDRIVLCSDGVSDVLTSARILAAIRDQAADQDRAANALIEAARKAKAADNVTALVIDLPNAAPKPRASLPKWMPWGLLPIILLALAGTVVALRPDIFDPRPTQIAIATIGKTPTAMITALAISPTPTVTPMAQTTAIITAQASAPPPEPNEPTSTPITKATHTPTPTLTRRVPTRPVETTRAWTAPVGGTPTSDFSSYVNSPILLKPSEREPVSGIVKFKWQPVALPSGAAYSLVWWKVGDDADVTNQSFDDPTEDTEQTVNLDDFIESNGEIFVAVLVVQAKPYNPIIPASRSNHRLLVYQRSSNGEATDQPPCVGPLCP